MLAAVNENPARRPMAAPTVVVAVRHAGCRTRLGQWLAHEYPSCRCLDAVSSEQARHIAISESPAVALVDIDMPAAQGFEILRMLRTLAPRARLVALSAYHAETYRDYAAGAGAAVCLPMGLPDSKLKYAIGALLAPPSAQLAA